MSTPAPDPSAPSGPAGTLVIGAGPAGLAAARALAGHGVRYDHVERHTEVGGIWDIDAPGSPMYDAAHFISSRTLSGFGGFPMPDDYPDYPSHRQILAYLRAFADRYGLTAGIRFGTEVREVTAVDGGFRVRFGAAGAGAGAGAGDGDGDRGPAGDEVRTYRAVICCSGSQWTPRMPELPGEFGGELRHSNTFRSADEVAGRRVLVIGGGNSACDIAVDAARTAERVVISMRRGYWFIPKHLFGVPADVIGSTGPHLPMWVQQRVFGGMLRLLVGDPRRVGLQRPDHRIFETHPVLNSNLHHALQHGDVTARPAIARIDDRTVHFVDGTREEVDEIIAATGYEHAIPYAQQLFGRGHPDLYLTAFSREHEGLFGLGFTETNSGAYGHFDELAQLIAGHLADRTADPERYRRFERHLRTDSPDLTGGIRFVDTPRHQGYVDADALTRYRHKLVKRWGFATRSPQPVGAGAGAAQR